MVQKGVKRFTAEITLPCGTTRTGEGSSKHEAEQIASKKLLTVLKNEYE